MYLSFVLLMAGRGKSLGTVDWCVATACHYVMYCLPVDDRSIRSGVALIVVSTTFSPVVLMLKITVSGPVSCSHLRVYGE